MISQYIKVPDYSHIRLGDFFNSPEEGSQPKRYNVILHRRGAALGDLTMGAVVSHLSIWDWCQLNGYNMVQLYPDATRNARANERTDLF